MSSEKAQKAAAILAEARLSGSVLEDLPPPLRPGALEEAYAVQYEIARLLAPIGGWKVGLPKAGEAPRATPIPTRFVIPTGGQWPPSAGTRIEVEFAVKMGTSLPVRSEPYRRAEVLSAIASAHIAFEMLGARFRDRKVVSPLTLLADGRSNGGLVVGEPIKDWTTLDLSKLEIVLEVDGGGAQSAQTTATGTPLDRTVEMLVWLANHASEHVGGLEAGQVILTGARIGPVAVSAGNRIEARARGAVVSVTLG